MKKIIITAALAAFMLGGYSQDKKEAAKAEKQVTIPQLVTKTFAAQYPKVAKVKWGIEKPGEYEAEFDYNKAEMSALYNEKGTLLETETEIKNAELPQAIRTTLAKDFVGYKFDEFEKAEANGIVTYEMEAKKDKKTFELVFDRSGKLINQEEEKE